VIHFRWNAVWFVLISGVFLYGCSDDELVEATDAGVQDATSINSGCLETSECETGHTCIGGVCVVNPTTEVRLTDNALDTEVSNAGIQLDCAGSLQEAPAGPEAATVYGRVDRFGGGLITTGMEVSFFKQSDWMASDCRQQPIEQQNECFRTEKSDWSTISTDPEATNPTIPTSCEKHWDCPAGYECVEISNGLSLGCEPQHGLYEVEGIPTNTLLVIRTRNMDPIYEKKWKDTYIFGVYLYADQVDSDGRIKSNAMMVSESQWKTVPNTLLVPGGIRKNNGALGGRVRDCRSAERSSFTLGNATIGLLEPGRATGYFNDDEANTVPLLDSPGTDMYGRFTVVDIPPGANTVAAAILQTDGAIASLGSESFYLVPNSLAIVSFPGKQPILTK